MSAPGQGDWTDDAELAEAMVMLHAEQIVEHERDALRALFALDDADLRSMPCLGLLDDAWSRLLWVAAVRGVDL